ncbi:MAG: hypothetical protein K5773_05605 [Pseudobutyrivibrio sp.]|nr:hypothetical protein [Pseudobutyrivibrio sp.]
MSRLVINKENAELETIRAARESQRKLTDKTSIILDINAFQDKVIRGEISDDKGKAELLINGLPSSYSLYIDRRVITSSDGNLITFDGLLKNYEPQEISIKYTKKPRRSMTLSQYKQYRQEYMEMKNSH